MRDIDSFSLFDILTGVALLVSCVLLAAGCLGFALVLMEVTA